MENFEKRKKPKKKIMESLITIQELSKLFLNAIEDCCRVTKLWSLYYLATFPALKQGGHVQMIFQGNMNFRTTVPKKSQALKGQ